MEFCKILSENGIDSIEISGNGTSIAGIKAEVAEKISVPIICVGGWRSLDEMEKILSESKFSKCVSCNACYRTPAHRCIFVK